MPNQFIEVQMTQQAPRRLMHLEKSGPAFDLKPQLEQSLVAQTQKALGEVFDALHRKQLLDLMPAWTRLLKLTSIQPSGQNRICLRRDWFWQEAESALIMAMVYCETESAAVKWQVADMVIRGQAVVAAHDCRKSLAALADVKGSGATCVMLLEHLTAYQEFSGVLRPDNEVGACPERGCDGVLVVFDAEAQANRRRLGADTSLDEHPHCSVCSYVAPEPR